MFNDQMERFFFPVQTSQNSARREKIDPKIDTSGLANLTSVIWPF